MTREEARARAKELVARMTLEEKISQMVYDSRSIERLGKNLITGGTRLCMGLPVPALQRFFLRQLQWLLPLTLNCWVKWHRLLQKKSAQNIMLRREKGIMEYTRA